jgi:hypothetical protein
MTETFGKRPPPGGSKITKIVPFKKLEDPEKCIIDLHQSVRQKGHRRMSLSSAMQLNINPGWALCAKETSGYNEYPQYRMKLLITTQLQTHALQRTGKGAIKSRIFRFSSKTSNHTFVELMALMWYHLSKRQVVEVQVQYHRNDYEKRSMERSADPFEKLFVEYIHLRPDVMLKAMPENCGIVVDPQTDNSGVVCWVMAPPHIDKNGTVSAPRSHTQELYKKREKAIKRLKAVEDQALKDNLEGLANGIFVGEEEKGSPGATDSLQRLEAMRAEMNTRRQARERLERELKERAFARERRKNQELL